MRKLSIFAITLAAAGTTGLPAAASPVPFGTVSAASVDASAADDPQFANSDISIVNGTITNNVVNGLQGGPGNTSGSTSASGSSVFATATATENGSFRFGGHNSTTASASADLASGTMHLLITPSGSEFFGSPSGHASATIGDVFTFNNTSGGTVALGLSLTIHGSFAPTTAGIPATAGHSLTAFLEIQSPQQQAQVSLGLQGQHHLDPRGDDYYAQIHYDGAQISSFSDNGSGANLQVTDLVSLAGTATPSLIDETMGTDLFLPAGISTLDLGARLDIDCNSAVLCDLAHTAALSFGPLPNGLSIVPSSGVALNGQGPTGVAEPGTLGTLAAGLLGLAVLRRRSA